MQRAFITAFFIVLKIIFGTYIRMAFGIGAVNPASAVKLAGNIAPIVSSGVYLAPVPTIRNVVQDKSVKSLPLLPYSSMIVNAFMWMTYGTY